MYLPLNYSGVEVFRNTNWGDGAESACKTPHKGKRSDRSRCSDSRCDPDQMQGLNVKGHPVIAESACLVLLGFYPQVNISESDSQGQSSWVTGEKAIISP